MKIRGSENITTQESQESESTRQSVKGSGKTARGISAVSDSVEVASGAAGTTEASGQRELTADEQAMAPKIDPENYTSLHSSADPRPALESKPFSKYKQPSPRGSNTLPNGQSPPGKPDMSQYNVQTNSAPSLDLKKAMGQIGSRGEKLKVLAGNISDKVNISFEDDKKRQQAARAAMGNNKDGVIDGLIDALSGLPKLFKEIEETREVWERNSPEEKEFEKAKAEHEKKEAIKREVQKTGNPPLQPLVDPPKGGGGVKYVPPDMDGSHGGSGGSGLIGPLIDSGIGKVLQGVTGKGQGGGEVVNPSDEQTGGGKRPVDDHGAFKSRLGYDNSQYLIGRPAGEEEKGFNGLSGSGNPQGNGGAIDYLDKSGWTGGTKTEEPGQVQTTPGGDGVASHLIQNNDDDDDDRK